MILCLPVEIRATGVWLLFGCNGRVLLLMKIKMGYAWWYGYNWSSVGDEIHQHLELEEERAVGAALGVMEKYCGSRTME